MNQVPTVTNVLDQTQQGQAQGSADARTAMTVVIADRIVAARERSVTTADPFSVAYLAAYQAVRPFCIARLVGATVQAREQQYTYTLVDPLSHPDYGTITMVVVWAVSFELSGPQTYVFVADTDGNPLPETPRLFRVPGANVARALAYIGYTAVS